MRCRHLREWIVVSALAVSSLASSSLPPATASESAGLPPDRVDSLLSSIALYPDPLLAKLLIAATYPLEVDEAELWLRQHASVTGAALDRAVASQSWDDSIKDLARLPAVLSVLDDRLEWTQMLGDTFLAQPDDVFASVQRLRAMARKAHTLHSTLQQKVTVERKVIRIEPAVAEAIDVPFYDPRVAYGTWPYPMYPPMWWTAPRGYIHGSGLGFMTGIGVPAAFWKDTVDWDDRKLLVNNAVGPGDHNRGTGTFWTHDPDHRRFVSYSTPQLRRRYGRGFPSGIETRGSLRGYDPGYELAVKRTVSARGRFVPLRQASNDTRLNAWPSLFDDIDQGGRERAFSKRGNASLAAARHDNPHFAIGEIAAGAAETGTIAAR